MDRRAGAEVEAAPCSKSAATTAVAHADDGANNVANAIGTTTPTTFEGRWEVVRRLLKEADRTRVARTLPSCVETTTRDHREQDYSLGQEERRREILIERRIDDDNNDSDDDRNERFLDSLRAQLLRIRVAGLLRHDFVLNKQLVELKALCREVGADLGGTNVFQDLWDIVGRRGKLAHPHKQSNATAAAAEQQASLAEDAAIVSQAREVLRKAAAAVNNNSSNSRIQNCVSARGRHGHSRSSSFGSHKGSPVPLSCSVEASKEEWHHDGTRPSHCCHNGTDAVRGRQGISPPLHASPNNTDNPSLYALAEGLGAAAAVDACLGFIAAEEKAVVNAARRRFGTTVDWARAVGCMVGTPQAARPAGRLESPPRKPALPPPSRREFKLWQRPGFSAEDRNCDAVGEGRQCSADDVGPPGAVDNGRDGRTALTKEQQTAVRCGRCPSWRLAREKVIATEALGSQHVRESSGSNSNSENTAPCTELKQSDLEDDRRIRCQSKATFSWESRRAPEDCPGSPQLSTKLGAAPQTPPSPLPPPPAPKPSLPTAVRNQFIDRAEKVEQTPLTPNGARRCSASFNFETGAEDCHTRHHGEAARVFPSPCSPRKNGGIRDPIDPGGDRQVAEKEGESDNQTYSEPSPVDLEAKSIWDPRNEPERDATEPQRCDCFSGNECLCEEHSTDASTETETTSPSQTFPSRAYTQTAADSTALLTHNTDRHRHRCRRRQRPSPRFNRESNRLENSVATAGLQPPPTPLLYAVEKSPTGSTEISADVAARIAMREEQISCALARKRALLRVRLARQQWNLAAAVAEANDQDFRAERRMRREERVAALLRKTCVGGATAGGSGRVEDCPVNFRGGHGADGAGGDKASRFRWGEQGLGVHREESRPRNGVEFRVSSAAWPGEGEATLHGGHGGRGNAGGTFWRPSSLSADGGNGRQDEGANAHLEDDANEEAPRQPLKVVPVEPDAVVGRLRSRWMMMRERMNGSCGPGGVSIASTRQATPAAESGDSHSCANVFELDSFSAASAASAASSTSSPLVVRLDTLYAIPGWRSHIDCRAVSGGGRFDWDGPCRGTEVYLVLEVGRLRHQTALQRPACCSDRCICRGRDVEQEGKEEKEEEEQGRGRDGGGRGYPKADDSWSFRETVVLHLATTEGEEQRASPADDKYLRVFVYTRNKSRLSRSRSPSRRRRPPPPSATARDSAPDDLVGVATLRLRRLAGGGAVASVGGISRRASECTFSRPVEVPVLGSDGSVALGWLGIGVCGMATRPS